MSWLLAIAVCAALHMARAEALCNYEKMACPPFPCPSGNHVVLERYDWGRQANALLEIYFMLTQAGANGTVYLPEDMFQKYVAKFGLTMIASHRYVFIVVIRACRRYEEMTEQNNKIEDLAEQLLDCARH